MEENNEENVQLPPINVAMSPIEMTEDGILRRNMHIFIPEEFIGSPDEVNILIEMKGYKTSLNGLMYSIMCFQDSDKILLGYEKQ